MTSTRTVTAHPAAGPRRRPGGTSGNRRRTAARRRPVRRRPARRRSPPTRRLRRALKSSPWWPALLVAVAVLVVVAWDADRRPAPAATAQCTLTASGTTLTGEQVANARTIADVAHRRGLPRRAVVIALATAMQESKLRNIPYGDRDSLGLFQQRPSQGWGTPEQVQDPAYAAGKFFDHLVQVPNWQTDRLTDVAQTVQRSAAPEAYQRWEPTATELAAALDGEGGLTCT